MTSQPWRVGTLCSKSQIDLDILLNCGQCFRWKRRNDVGWIGVIGHHVWHLQQTGTELLYKVYGQQEMKPVVADGKSKENVGLSEDCTEKNFVANEVRCNDKKELIKRDKWMRKSPNEDGQTIIFSKKCSKSSVRIIKDNEKMIQDSFHQPSIAVVDTVVKKETPFNDHIIKEENDNSFLHSSKECEEILRDYFQLDVNICELYNHWSSKDSHFKEVADKFKGIRMLRQDPTENLLSFVCSSNNHISRISSMVEKLCTHYGKFITEVDGQKFYSFPEMSALTGNEVESHLRELGFGYRAKFISAIAKYITKEKEEGWLESLRQQNYEETKSELMKLMGVGAKVADCVCLMSLDKPQAIPVDTHVWQITQKNYMAKLQSAKSLTNKLYNEIGDFYRMLWGPYAGWAHSVLFTADLKHNKAKHSDPSPVVTEKIKEEKGKKALKRGGKRKDDTEDGTKKDGKRMKKR